MTAPAGGRDLEGWLTYIQSVHFRSVDMTLERVAAVLERFSSRPAFAVIAVAGTNGKGSCAAMLGSILAECGHRVGVYSSPHLVRFNERIRVNGTDADDATLCGTFAHVESVRGEIPLTYFEFGTLAAVLVFQSQSVDYAVMEVGMGGRLDAVNALPIDAALITNIGLDHTRWLGTDRQSIGGEKAHIMRPGRPAVYSDTRPVRAVINHAERIAAPLLLAGRDYHIEPAERGWSWRGPSGEHWRLGEPPIPGAYQKDNAAGVLALLSALGPAIGLTQPRASRGLDKTRLRGRCEIIARRPLVIVDVAHNLPAIEVLKGQLLAYPVAGGTAAVFGMLEDKDAAAVAAALDDIVDAWHLAGIADPRGRTAAELAGLIQGHVGAPVSCHATVAQAFEHARRQSRADDRIVVFGSFHIAGDILQHLSNPS